jgi:hypothetical protein
VTSAPFYGWVVVGAAFSVLLMSYGAQFSFGVFFSALLEEFGWSRAGLSAASLHSARASRASGAGLGIEPMLAATLVSALGMAAIAGASLSARSPIAWGGGRPSP